MRRDLLLHLFLMSKGGTGISLVQHFHEKGRSTLSVSLLLMQRWEEWLKHDMVVLLLSETWAGWMLVCISTG